MVTHRSWVVYFFCSKGRLINHVWDFQGSLDGKSWKNLRVHENDWTVCKPGQFASWPITGPNALLPFRYFRVVLTGSTTDATNPWNLCICYLELYGYFLWEARFWFGIWFGTHKHVHTQKELPQLQMVCLLTKLFEQCYRNKRHIVLLTRQKEVQNLMINCFKMFFFLRCWL